MSFTRAQVNAAKEALGLDTDLTYSLTVTPTHVYVTEVAGTHGCDRFFPEYRNIEGLAEEYDPRSRFMASADGKERYKFKYYKMEG